MGGTATSLAGGFIGAVEGAGLGTLGNWLGNFIISSRDGGFVTCDRITTARRYCQDNMPQASMMHWGYRQNNEPPACYQ